MGKIVDNFEVMLSGPSWKCLGFQVPVTPTMEGIVDLNAFISFYLIVILTVVSWVLLAAVKYFYYDRYNPGTGLHVFGISKLHGGSFWEDEVYLEGGWTLIPSFILLSIAVPSFCLLYSMEELVNPALTVKITGHQWYWSYEYAAVLHKGNERFGVNDKFDSYIVAASDLGANDLRLLTVDQALILPLRVHTRLVITSDDVIHSWAVPSLGVKVDAVPGRINQAMVYIQKAGTYYGQCSEICGTGHGFMPIVVEAVDWGMFVLSYNK